jgi:Tfp pilus assembly protein PilN
MPRGINLIPYDMQRGWRERKLKAALVFGAAAYLAALSALYLDQRSRLSEKRQELAGVLDERDAAASRISGYADLSRKISEIRGLEDEHRKRLGATAELAEKKVSWSMVLKKLSHSVPEGVWLKTLSTTDAQAGKKLRFLGSSTTARGVSEFIFGLENSGNFTDVSLAYSQKRDFDKESVFDFEVYAALKKTDEIIYE